MSGPLSSLKVLDFTTLLPGPMGAMIMAEKCAEMFVGAASISATGVPEFMPQKEVERICGRPDEEYRRKILNFTN